MKILFFSKDAYLPQLIGGSQRSTDQLCQVLIERGHQISVLAGLSHSGFFGLKSRIKMQMNMRIHGCKIALDSKLGYHVWRSWHSQEAITYVVKKEQPDLIIVMSGESAHTVLAEKLNDIPVLIKLHDIFLIKNGDNFKGLDKLTVSTNSHFTAKAYHKAFGLNPIVIYLFIRPEQYKTITSRKNITFINPVPEKGCDIALKIAEFCPDIPFNFVPGWPLSAEASQSLNQKLSFLPNVTLIKPQSDMRRVYANCKILLVPSLCEEAYGRVVTEAQVSGIPVIASNRGGLPESVGTGGVLLDPDAPIEDWVKAVRKLWEDEPYYAKLSAASIANTERPESTLSYKIDLWEKIISKAVHEHKKEEF